MKRNALIAPLCCLALACGPQIARAQAVWPSDVLPEKNEGVSAGFATGSVLVNSFNVLSTLHNTGGSSPRWGYMGVLGGVLGMGLGGASLAQDTEAKPLAVASLAIGALATFSAFSAIRHSRPDEQEDQGDQAVGAGHSPVHFSAGVVGAHQHGLGVQLKF